MISFSLARVRATYSILNSSASSFRSISISTARRGKVLYLQTPCLRLIPSPAKLSISTSEFKSLLLNCLAVPARKQNGYSKPFDLCMLRTRTPFNADASLAAAEGSSTPPSITLSIKPIKSESVFAPPPS